MWPGDNFFLGLHFRQINSAAVFIQTALCPIKHLSFTAHCLKLSCQTSLTLCLCHHSKCTSDEAQPGDERGAQGRRQWCNARPKNASASRTLWMDLTFEKKRNLNMVLHKCTVNDHQWKRQQKWNFVELKISANASANLEKQLKLVLFNFIEKLSMDNFKVGLLCKMFFYSYKAVPSTKHI